MRGVPTGMAESIFLEPELVNTSVGIAHSILQTNAAPFLKLEMEFLFYLAVEMEDGAVW